MKRLLALLPIAAFFVACAEPPSPSKVKPDQPPTEAPAAPPKVAAAPVDFKDDKQRKEPVADDGEFKIAGKPQFVTNHIDKKWGLVSSASNSLVKRTTGGMEEFKIVFTFQKDLTAKDVAEIKQAIRPGEKDVVLAWVAFDQDNVSLMRYHTYKVEGDISGVMGDAFRVYIRIDTDTLKRTQKVEARFTDGFKDKDKDKDRARKDKDR